MCELQYNGDGAKGDGRLGPACPPKANRGNYMRERPQVGRLARSYKSRALWQYRAAYGPLHRSP